MAKEVELRAYWPTRIPQLGMCRVIELNFEDKSAAISNGIVRVFPSLGEIILMEYTGAKDKKDKKVFDGDIVLTNDGHLYEVYWHDQFSFSLRDHRSKQFHGSLTSCEYIVPEEMKFEIVGNIYEGSRSSKKEEIKYESNT